MDVSSGKTVSVAGAPWSRCDGRRCVSARTARVYLCYPAPRDDPSGWGCGYRLHTIKICDRLGHMGDLADLALDQHIGAQHADLTPRCATAPSLPVNLARELD